MRKVLIVLVAVAACASLLVAGCASKFDDTVVRFDSGLQRVNDKIQRYAPIIGRDVLLIGNILVTAECSPFMPVASKQVKNVLDIKAANSAGAAKVNGILAGNMQIAEALCPLVDVIKTGVGQVPAIAPSQVIAAPAPAPAPVVVPAPAVVPAAAK